eukprot:m.72975 g.72975  ORF g.72975 m.72975 type:complete len:400 (+) comp14298_c0_seq5:76-1275(+)
MPFSTLLSGLLLALFFCELAIGLTQQRCQLGSLLLRDQRTRRALCLCLDQRICIGHECVNGALNETHYGSAYPLGCIGCQCSPMSPVQRNLLPMTTWSNSEYIYHVHASKTGGTTIEHILRDLTTSEDLPKSVTMCQTEKHPFSNPPLFADPNVLRSSGCTVVSAEGELRYTHKQFNGVTPRVMVFLRHPALRTLSQWHHDHTYENDKLHGTVQDRQRYTANCSTLLEYYTQQRALGQKPHRRYANWQYFIYDSTLYQRSVDLAKFQFVGVTDYFRTSLCLFYFTFQLQSRFDDCQTRPLSVYNAACKDDTCAFINKANVPLEQHPHEALRASLARIDPETVAGLKEATTKDLALYKEALDIFWTRVAIMEQVSGQIFPDLPDRYRVKHTREYAFDSVE